MCVRGGDGGCACHRRRWRVCACVSVCVMVGRVRVRAYLDYSVFPLQNSSRGRDGVRVCVREAHRSLRSVGSAYGRRCDIKRREICIYIYFKNVHVVARSHRLRMGRSVCRPVYAYRLVLACTTTPGYNCMASAGERGRVYWRQAEGNYHRVVMRAPTRRLIVVLPVVLQFAHVCAVQTTRSSGLTTVRCF